MNYCAVLATILIIHFGKADECLEDFEFALVQGELSATFTFPR